MTLAGPPAGVGNRRGWERDRYAALQRELGYRVYLVGIGKGIRLSRYGSKRKREERRRKGEGRGRSSFFRRRLDRERGREEV